jgi:hypothetical protein
LSIAIDGILRMPLFLITHFVSVFRSIGAPSLLFLLFALRLSLPVSVCSDYDGDVFGVDHDDERFAADASVSGALVLSILLPLEASILKRCRDGAVLEMATLARVERATTTALFTTISRSELRRVVPLQRFEAGSHVIGSTCSRRECVVRALSLLGLRVECESSSHITLRLRLPCAFWVLPALQDWVRIHTGRASLGHSIYIYTLHST